MARQMVKRSGTVTYYSPTDFAFSWADARMPLAGQQLASTKIDLGGLFRLSMPRTLENTAFRARKGRAKLQHAAAYAEQSGRGHHQ
jgi:hypothetical protein